MALNSRPPITVAMAQFEDIVNRGLQAVIESDPHLSLVATDIPPERLGDTLEMLAPDVAILNFGSLASPADLRDLHARLPELRLTVLANNPTPAESRQLIGFGATACLAKNAEARDLVHTIYLASRGMHVLPSPAAETVEDGGPSPLTAREADVLELLQSGGSNAEIAAQLHVGVETVRTHARHIYRKLGVRTRRELRST